MSSCIIGGSRACGFDLEIVKSPSTSTRNSRSSSPSSTLSESTNYPLGISTRKPRTPRKRPNQTYNEAAALLSTAYPYIFSTKHLTKSRKFANPHDTFFSESSESLQPFQVIVNSSFLLHQPMQEKPNFRVEPRVLNSCERPCQSPVENDFRVDSSNLFNVYQEDFDTESILDEEIEVGIDSIMGNVSVNNDSVDESNVNTSYGHPMELGFCGKFHFDFGMRRGFRGALRHVDEGDWWRFPTVDVLDISPKLNKVTTEKKKKKIEKPVEAKSSESPGGISIPRQQKENSQPKLNPGLLLKLNYDEVLNAWSDGGSPFSEEIPRHENSRNDLHVCFSSVARK